MGSGYFKPTGVHAIIGASTVTNDSSAPHPSDQNPISSLLCQLHAGVTSSER